MLDDGGRLAEGCCTVFSIPRRESENLNSRNPLFSSTLNSKTASRSMVLCSSCYLSRWKRLHGIADGK